MRQFWYKKIDKEGGNKEKMRKCREWVSLHSPCSLNFLILSPFPLDFLILSPFSRNQDARMQQVVQPWLFVCEYVKTIHELENSRYLFNKLHFTCEWQSRSDTGQYSQFLGCFQNIWRLNLRELNLQHLQFLVSDFISMFFFFFFILFPDFENMVQISNLRVILCHCGLEKKKIFVSCPVSNLRPCPHCTAP